MVDWQERSWDDLLDYIEERTVVPVIGSELVTVRENGGDLPLACWLARRLAADLQIPNGEFPEGFDLNDVVSLHLRRRGDPDELYPRIHRLLRNAALPPPQALRELAGIPGLDLFVSLTFDSLLAEALGEARGGAARVDQVVYSPNRLADLAGPKAELTGSTVFHLLGRASVSRDYALCDEDLLEFLHALQDKQRQPRLLFDELRTNHLLILGCDFGDWLARFFLRTARSLELSQRRRRWDLLVGHRMASDSSFTLFLESFSSDARVIPLSPASFVSELAARWKAAHPAASPGSKPAIPEDALAARVIPQGAIFISYASEDVASASRLAEGLRSAELEVWFDKDALQPADDWSRIIRRGIEQCSLFLPVISRQSTSKENRRRFFWREWNAADDLAQGMARDEPFVVPVVIDDTRIDHAPLPDSFQRAQGTTLPGGKVTLEVAERLIGLVREFHRRRRAA